MAPHLKTSRQFLISTVLAWTVSGVLASWFLSSPVRFVLRNGFVGLAIVGSMAALTISLVQCYLVDECSYSLWTLATVAAIGIGIVGGSLAYLLAHFPGVDWQSGIFLIDWALWPAIVFFLMAIVGAASGLVAGPLQRWAVGRGTLLRWILVSTGSWALSLGVAGLAIQAINYPYYFKLGVLRFIPFPLKVGVMTLLIGIIQGSILGAHLQRLKGQSP